MAEWYNAIGAEERQTAVDVVDDENLASLDGGRQRAAQAHCPAGLQRIAIAFEANELDSRVAA